MDLQQELDAIDAVLADLCRGRNEYYFNTANQMAQRLKGFLKDRNMSITRLIAENLGEAELITGAGIMDSTRRVYTDTLRTIFNHLCERGITALAYDHCIIPAIGMNPHRLPRGLKGFPEAVTGIYPDWLIPERFRRGIANNAAMPKALREEFRRFAESEKHELNERSLYCYWSNLQTLATGLKLESLQELAEPDAIARLAKLIEESGYTKKTSTLNHWRKMLRHAIGARNPFDRKNEFGDFLLRLPKSRPKPPIKEGVSFQRGGYRHILIGGEVMEERVTRSDLKRLLHTPMAGTDLRELQEDMVCRFLAVIKDRPVELYARNHASWQMFLAQAGNEDSLLYAGDGYIQNNFRESIRKNRTDKPFPLWLKTRLDSLWTIRRAHFADRGDPDLKPSSDPGLIRPEKPLWVDPRTGVRASQGQLLSWTRNGLIRAGWKKDVADRTTARWFRRGVITGEIHNATLLDAVCKTSGHDSTVARRHYIGSEKAIMVAIEREQYWKPMGIAGNVTVAAPPPLERPRIEVAPLPPQEPGPGGDGLPTAEAAARLGKSVETLRRWAYAGLIRVEGPAGAPSYSSQDIDNVRDHFVTPQMAGKMSDVSDSYVRRLCREQRIPGLRRVGRKTYLIPVGVAMRLKEIGTKPQIRNQGAGGFGTGASLGL